MLLRRERQLKRLESRPSTSDIAGLKSRSSFLVGDRGQRENSGLQAASPDRERSEGRNGQALLACQD